MYTKDHILQPRRLGIIRETLLILVVEQQNIEATKSHAMMVQQDKNYLQVAPITCSQRWP
jgi:hypothetical protein